MPDGASMLIDMLTQDFPPTPGGIASHVDELSKALVRAGHKVRLFIPCFDAGDVGTTTDEEGRAFVRVRRKTAISNDGKVSRVLKTLGYVGELREALRVSHTDRRPDVIHAHNTYLEPQALKPFTLPKVMTEHESSFLKFAAYPIAPVFLKRQFRQFGHIITPSDELLETCRDVGYTGPMTFISNGVDSTYFVPEHTYTNDRVRELEKATEGIVRLFTPRRLEPKNGVHHLMEAMTHLREDGVHLIVAGDGTQMEPLTKYIEDEGLTGMVTLLGSVPKEMIRDLIALSDLCVFPSLMEATSIACLECMSMARPVVSTNVGGLPFLIADGENGTLVPPADPTALADAIRGLVDDPQKRTSFGDVGRQRVVERFSWDVIAEQVADVYTSVVEQDP